MHGPLFHWVMVGIFTDRYLEDKKEEWRGCSSFVIWIFQSMEVDFDYAFAFRLELLRNAFPYTLSIVYNMYVDITSL